jgi:L-threonylcarbamoyladenylate synthase
MFSKLSDGLDKQVEKGIAILKRGGLVAYPTDTVYGLGASADISDAVRRIYKVKKRPLSMAFPLLLAHISQISDVAVNVPPLAWFLAAKFLPGALTLVLYRSNCVSDVVAGGSSKVGVRVPAHPVPIALVSGIGAPLVGTSANLSRHPSAVTAEEVAVQIGSAIDLVIDGGRAPGGIESTVVDVTGESPVILRQGTISLEELENAVRFFDPHIRVIANDKNG